MLMIRPMTSDDDEQVRQLDALSFARTELRSVDNVAALRANNPDGCLLALAHDIPIGYIFTHTFGTVGYLGPLGVSKEFQDRGYGKKMIQQGIQHLSRKCTVIGLETFPIWGKNIGLYHRLGFQTTLPCRMVTKNIEKPHPVKLANTLLGTEIPKKQITSILNRIRSWTNSIHQNLDFSNDINYFLSIHPDRILFYLDGENVLGFLAFESHFNPFVWGIIQPLKHDEEILKALIYGVENLNWTTPLSYHYHTHNLRLTDIFLECGYHIHQDVTCMLLKNYEGCYTQTMSSLLIRSWWG